MNNHKEITKYVIFNLDYPSSHNVYRERPRELSLPLELISQSPALLSSQYFSEKIKIPIGKKNKKRKAKWVFRGA